jgi:hypothetical protein
MLNLLFLVATQEQLSDIFEKTRLEVEPIRIPDTSKINESNWEEHLGTAS